VRCLTKNSTAKINDEYDDEGEMPWDSAARQAIESALEDVTFDEIRGVVYSATHMDVKRALRRCGPSSARCDSHGNERRLSVKVNRRT
jgi:hypothetical protein